MSPNVGTIDRALRLILGLALIALPLLGSIALFDNSTYKTIAIVAGIVLVGTAAFKFCPLYRIVGMRTCPR